MSMFLVNTSTNYENEVYLLSPRQTTGVHLYFLTLLSNHHSHALSLTGSPFLVKIGGEPSGRLTERIMRQREAADVTQVGSQCELSLTIPGTSPHDMDASVTSPSGVVEACDIQELDDCHYSIKFVPKEMGVHTVSVKHRDMHIPGSPFQFTVGPITDGGSHKVRAIGPGLERGEVDKPCEYYTRSYRPFFVSRLYEYIVKLSMQ